MKLFFIITGILCIVYCLSILLFTGYGSLFFLMWGILGSILLIWVKVGDKVLLHLPGWLKKTTGILICFGILLFVCVEGMIVSGFFEKGRDNLDYIIVLGAQLKENGPSYSLQMRLDAAIEYLEKNAGTQVIVSGGQGSNEPDSEAQGMYDYLVKKGISPDRIIKEPDSTSTNENIRFSSKLLDTERDSVGIVTSNFHVFRGMHLAKAAGYRDVCGIAAASHWYYLPNNMLREFFGVVKDYLVGNM